MTPQQSTRVGLFIAFGVVLAALNVETLRGVVAVSRANETASHLVLIPFVSAALILLQRHEIFASLKTATLPGFLVGGAGVAVLIGERAHRGGVVSNDSLSIMMAALVVTLIGSFLLCFGVRAFRTALFPLLFLVFAIPIPLSALAAATRFLKAGSTETVAGLFQLTGTPHHRDGFVFTLPTFVIEVADECSGIRSSIGLLLTALLAGHLFLRSWWRKAILVVAVVPLAMLKNGIRIATLSLLAEHVDRGYLTGQLHHEGGIVFFLLTLALLAPLFIILEKSEMKAAGGAAVS
jgi:exosortase